jgi:hypothetical protein
MGTSDSARAHQRPAIRRFVLAVQIRYVGFQKVGVPPAYIGIKKSAQYAAKRSAVGGLFHLRKDKYA